MIRRILRVAIIAFAFGVVPGIASWAMFAAVLPPQQAAKPVVKPIALTSVQVRYFEQVNQDIESLPEVKALRAKQQAFITGIATSHGITGNWRLTPDGNGGLFLDMETKP